MTAQLLGVDELERGEAPGRATGAFERRRLKEPYPYLILDARYEKVREYCVVGSRAVLIALGIDSDGRR